MPTLKKVPWDGQQEALGTELRALREEQRAVLEMATYVGMSAHTAQEYERRATRITEIQCALRLKPEATNDL